MNIPSRDPSKQPLTRAKSLVDRRFEGVTGIPDSALHPSDAKMYEIPSMSKPEAKEPISQAALDNIMATVVEPYEAMSDDERQAVHRVVDAPKRGKHVLEATDDQLVDTNR